MLKEPFVEAIEILDTLISNGYETYFVGGCVRDTLLGKKIKDIDIATAASPKVVQSLFEKVIPVGIEHGTVIVRLGGESYEVTTFRRDGKYSDQRRPDDVEFVMDIEEDLKRRDFTINALAMTADGEIIDLFHGKSDLQKGIIQTVGTPANRFTEDPLRIIRALRFVSVLGFSIEENTLREMKAYRSWVESLAIERLTSEFERFFSGDFLAKGINYLGATGIVNYLPILRHHPQIIAKLPQLLTPFISFAEVITLFHYYEQTVSISEWTKAWKVSNKVKNEALTLKYSLDNYLVNGLSNLLVYELAEKNFPQFIHLINIVETESSVTITDLTRINDTLQIKTRSEIEINGNEIIQLLAPIKPGPWMNTMFMKIESLIVMNLLTNDKKAIKEWILCHPPVIN